MLLPKESPMKESNRTMKILLFLCALIACLSIPRTAQAQQAWLTETQRGKFETLRIAGSEALFNLDYEGARKNFKKMALDFPNYPAGSQFLADTLWAET